MHDLTNCKRISFVLYPIPEDRRRDDGPEYDMFVQTKKSNGDAEQASGKEDSKPAKEVNASEGNESTASEAKTATSSSA